MTTLTTWLASIAFEALSLSCVIRNIIDDVDKKFGIRMHLYAFVHLILCGGLARRHAAILWDSSVSIKCIATEDPFDSPDPRLPPAELPGPVVQQRNVGIEELLVVLMVFLCRIDLLQFRVLPSISNCFSTKVSMVQLPMLVLDSYESKSNFFYVYESRQLFNCTIQVPRMNQHCHDMVRFLCWIVAYLPARQLKGFQTRSCGVSARPVAFALLGHLDMVPRQQFNG